MQMSQYALIYTMDDLSDITMNDKRSIAELLLEALPLTSDGVAVFDAQARIGFSNAAWGELFDVPPQHSANLTFAQLIEYGRQRREGIAIQPNALKHWLEQIDQQHR